MRELWAGTGKPGGRLWVLSSEAGPRAPWPVLWPGLGATAEQFLRLLREGPGERWNVAALDPPGHGKSDWWPQWSDSSPPMVWETVLEAIGRPKNPIVGGHSAGAGFALDWAAREPDHCGGVLLLEGGYLDPLGDGATTADDERDAENYHRSFRFRSWEAYERAQQAEAGSWDDGVAAMLRALMMEDAGEVRLAVDVEAAKAFAGTLARRSGNGLPTLACPALLATAGMPPDMAAARRAAARLLQERIPHLQHVEIRHAGHDLMVDRPDVVSQVVWAFLRDAGGGRPGGEPGV